MEYRGNPGFFGYISGSKRGSVVTHLRVFAKNGLHTWRFLENWKIHHFEEEMHLPMLFFAPLLCWFSGVLIEIHVPASLATSVLLIDIHRGRSKPCNNGIIIITISPRAPFMNLHDPLFEGSLEV